MSESYFGADLSRLDYERIGLERVPAHHRVEEAAVMQSRWFDYWHLHPVEATYYFAYLYAEQTRLWFEANVDIRTAADARAFVPNDVFKGRDGVPMWLARQVCDRHGIPYDFALGYAQRHYAARGFHRFPRPNQLTGEEYELDMRDAWLESMKHTLRYSPHLKASRWPLPSTTHTRHGEFVIRQIKARPQPHHGLLGRMFHQQVIHPAQAVEHFTDAEIARAAEVAGQLG